MAWRLDAAIHGASWDAGIGAALGGGRWNSAGTHALYSALDPATAIMEVAVHTGFDDLDQVPRILTSFTLAHPSGLRVVAPSDVPNPNWLCPGRPSANQQRFGDRLLAEHGTFVIPSTVSSHSWNLVFLAGVFDGYRLRAQERFALDPRLAS